MQETEYVNNKNTNKIKKLTFLLLDFESGDSILFIKKSKK